MANPVVSYYKSGDPTANYCWVSKLTDINVIQTKRITDEFIKFCIDNKHRVYLHIVVTGMGKTPFEPNIPTVRETFFQIKKLIDSGFPQKQILIIVKNILSNDNGLRALELLLKVFTEYRALRLRAIRFELLRYKQLENGKYVIASDYILTRPAIKGLMTYLIKTSTFFKDYYNLLDKYRSIITIDNSEEAVIGIRELIVFGYKNQQPDGSKIIEYEKGNKFKPIVELLSNKNAVRCKNRCLLCPHRY